MSTYLMTHPINNMEYSMNQYTTLPSLTATARRRSAICCWQRHVRPPTKNVVYVVSLRAPRTQKSQDSIQSTAGSRWSTNPLYLLHFLPARTRLLHFLVHLSTAVRISCIYFLVCFGCDRLPWLHYCSIALKVETLIFDSIPSLIT